MAILIDRSTRLLVQGITGRQAHLNTRYMLEYGTQVVAGVTPGKGGQRVDAVPVYNSVKEALKAHPDINATILYVPPAAVKKAAVEAIDAGIPLILITTERCAQQETMELIAMAKKSGSRVIGPNSIGILNPDECVIGLIGARKEMAKQCFRPGRVGVISRSGGQTSTLSFYLTMAGFGQSTAVGIGGDAFIGTTARDVLELFQKDSSTDAVVYFGEVGTFIEEEAADFLKNKGFSKPFIAYVAGRYVSKDVRYGHAGALISHGMGDVSEKLKRFEKSGARVLLHLDDVVKELGAVLSKPVSPVNV